MFGSEPVQFAGLKQVRFCTPIAARVQNAAKDAGLVCAALACPVGSAEGRVALGSPATAFRYDPDTVNGRFTLLPLEKWLN